MGRCGAQNGKASFARKVQYKEFDPEGWWKFVEHWLGVVSDL